MELCAGRDLILRKAFSSAAPGVVIRENARTIDNATCFTVISPIVLPLIQTAALRHNRLRRVPFSSDQLATDLGKAPGKLLIRMMRREAGKHLGAARPIIRRFSISSL
jgi:hypothetical protein